MKLHLQLLWVFGLVAPFLFPLVLFPLSQLRPNHDPSVKIDPFDWKFGTSLVFAIWIGRVVAVVVVRHSKETRKKKQHHTCTHKSDRKENETKYHNGSSPIQTLVWPYCGWSMGFLEPCCIDMVAHGMLAQMEMDANTDVDYTHPSFHYLRWFHLFHPPFSSRRFFSSNLGLWFSGRSGYCLSKSQCRLCWLGSLHCLWCAGGTNDAVGFVAAGASIESTFLPWSLVSFLHWCLVLLVSSCTWDWEPSSCPAMMPQCLDMILCDWQEKSAYEYGYAIDRTSRVSQSNLTCIQ